MENRILIVDDEKTVILQVMSLLKSFGYQTDFIPNPKLVVRKLASAKYDLILLDINMPDVDGISVLWHLKDHDEYRDIPVIMMTGDTNEQTLETCFELGANDYITKPIQQLVLKARVKSAIEKQEFIAQLDKHNREIDQSISYAKNIQNAVLPTAQNIRKHIPKLFVLYRPKDVVSGDFYWFAKVDNKWILASVDCTGHGVPGAFMSMIGNSYLRQIVEHDKVLEPDQVLRQLNQRIFWALQQRDNRGIDGMDMALCVIDPSKKQLHFAGALQPLIYFEDGELHQIKGSKFPVGGAQNFAKRQYDKHTVNYTSNTVFYIFSDGFADQFGGEKKRKFMSRRFRHLLSEIHQAPLSEQKIRLEEQLDQWKGDIPQVDDILVLGFQLP